MPKRVLSRAVAVFCLLPTLKGSVFAQNIQLSVRPGTTLVVAGNHFVLNNTNVQCDGSLNSGPAMVWITGSNNSQFGGAGVPLIGNLTMNSSPSTTLAMSGTLQVIGHIDFQQGSIDLNGQQLQLSNGAFLQNESEASHITGLTGGSVTALATGVNNPNQLNVGQLGAALTSAANLGTLTVSRSGRPAMTPGNSALQGIDRTYTIQPQNNSGLNATLRFYYLNEELNGKDPNTLNLWKSFDGVSWVLVGADTRNTAQKYVEKTGINDLSLWTLTDVATPLPVTLVSFKATCEGGLALVQWQTGVETGVDYYLVQGSPDAGQWTSLDKIIAGNAPQGSAYSFQDEHPSTNSFYRLAVVNQSGSVSYSPVFRGGCSDIPVPFTLYPNPAESQAVAQLSVRQSTTATIQVADISGKVLYRAQWNLSPGLNTYLLPVSTLAAGHYIVNLLLPNTILQTKLIKK